MRKYALGSSLMIMMSLAHALALPKGCKPLEVSSQIHIKKETPLVVFYSLAKEPIYLSYHNQRGDAHAGYSTVMKSNRYSLAFVAKDFDMSYHCVESGYGYAQRVNCKQAISVCSFDKKTKGLADNTAFWLLENVPLTVLEEKLIVFSKSESAK